MGSHLRTEMQTEHNKQVLVVGCVLFLASEITVKRKKIDFWLLVSDQARCIEQKGGIPWRIKGACLLLGKVARPLPVTPPILL